MTPTRRVDIRYDGAAALAELQAIVREERRLPSREEQLKIHRKHLQLERLPDEAAAEVEGAT